MLQFKIFQIYTITSYYNTISPYYNPKMGSKPAKSQTKLTQLSNFNSENGDVYEQFEQMKTCCGIQYIITIKKKLVWQNQFNLNCQSIKHECRWANQLLELVNRTRLSRTKYIVEVNQIKKNTESLIIPENQVLLTPGEVEEFKANLKKSVLLSFGQAKQQLNEAPKITSTINPQILQRTTQKLRQRNAESFRMSRVVKNQRSISNKRSQSRSDLRKSIMSFVDDTLSSVFGGPDKEISKQNAKAVQNFLNFSVIIEKHFTDEKNILCRLQRVFISYMGRFYSDPKIASRDIEAMTNQIKQYLVLMRETIFDYYNLVSFDDEQLYALITNDENVLTVLTSILFKDKGFYQMVFNAIVEFNLDNDDILAQILAKLEGTTPQFFGILDQYCLNQLTLQKSDDKAMSLGSAEGKIDNLDVNELRTSSIETPYKICMDMLRELQRSRTPVGKMKIIMSCSERITKCISRFYQSNGLKSEHWVLDADQILSIFCYVLANARVPHLHTHLFILQNFSTDHQLISVTGYYYSVLTCALEQIEMNYRDLIV